MAHPDPARAGGLRSHFLGLNHTRQRDMLADLAGQGKSDEEIGELFALSQWQVRNLRYRLGVKKDRKGRVRLQSVRQQPRAARTSRGGAATASAAPAESAAGRNGTMGASHGMAQASHRAALVHDSAASQDRSRETVVRLQGTYAAGELARVLSGMQAFFAAHEREVPYRVQVVARRAAAPDAN